MAELSTEKTNFFIGTAIFGAIAVVLGIVMFIYVGCKTKDPAMKGANQCMACGLSWLALFYMWIMWSTFYQAQMFPYVTITPELDTDTKE